MSPIALFLQADIVVKVVMVGLVLASLWTWTIIVGQWIRMRRVGQLEMRPEIVVTDTIPAPPQDLVVVAVRREQVRAAAQQAAAATAGTGLLFGLQTTLSGAPDAAQALERVTDLAAARQRSDRF